MHEEQTTSTDRTGTRPLPWVGVSVFAVCLTLSVLCLLAASQTASSKIPIAVFAGDSFTGNYRFDEGERLQDLVGHELDGEVEVLNHAKPGARTLDIFMQVHQALWFHPRMDAVIIPLQTSKLLPWESPARMDKRGDNLKWWDVDLDSELWASLNMEYRRKVVIHKAGLLVGFIDMIEYLYVTHIQSPRERAEMREDRPSRREKIKRKIRDISQHWNDTPVVQSEVFESQASQDLEMLVRDLKERDVAILIVIVPTGNPELVSEVFSAQAQRNIEDARLTTVAWCNRNEVDFVDLSKSLPGSAYDDFSHLKGVEGNQVIASAVSQWIKGNLVTD